MTTLKKLLYAPLHEK